MMVFDVGLVSFPVSFEMLAVLLGIAKRAWLENTVSKLND